MEIDLPVKGAPRTPLASNPSDRTLKNYSDTPASTSQGSGLGHVRNDSGGGSSIKKGSPMHKRVLTTKNLSKDILNSSINRVDSTMANKLQLLLKAKNSGKRPAQNNISNPVDISSYVYSPTNYEIDNFDSSQMEKIAKMPDGAVARWVDVDDVDLPVLTKLEQQFHIHPLAKLHVADFSFRPKFEDYGHHIFLVTTLIAQKPGGKGELTREQVSFFLIGKTVITIQGGEPGDCWDGLRHDLQNPESKLRHSDSSYLLFSLLCAVIEPMEPIVYSLDEQLSDIEIEMYLRPTSSLNQKVHQVKRKQIVLRSCLVPMKRVVAKLVEVQTRLEKNQIRANDKNTLTSRYFNELHDKIGHLVEKLDNQKELAAQLNAMYTEHQATRQGEVGYILAIVSVFFLPLTFIAGVYGMNFAVMPELMWDLGYLYCWMLFLAVVLICIFLFMYLGWMPVPGVKQYRNWRRRRETIDLDDVRADVENEVGPVQSGTIPHFSSLRGSGFPQSENRELEDVEAGNRDREMELREINNAHNAENSVVRDSEPTETWPDGDSHV